ncbi:hypothetical protein Taro_011351 [Colocasia esculenta]|uniref:Uncharacterized protein n=1 Tax=Colocasia esculenta TaxID=4460 RepID=A0A843UAB5_COLES|nr:hypothetical protein [Colocasia esculenta]
MFFTNPSFWPELKNLDPFLMLDEFSGVGGREFFICSSIESLLIPVQNCYIHASGSSRGTRNCRARTSAASRRGGTPSSTSWKGGVFGGTESSPVAAHTLVLGADDGLSAWNRSDGPFTSS